MSIGFLFSNSWTGGKNIPSIKVESVILYRGYGNRATA